MSKCSKGDKLRLTVRIHVQVFQKVVRQSLVDICTIQLKGHEHNTRPYLNQSVNEPMGETLL